MLTEEGRKGRLDKKTWTTAQRLQDLQRKLYLKAKSEPNFRFYMLYDKVFRWDVIKEAWKNVRSNGGAPGIDGVTIEEIESSDAGRYLNGIQKELINKTYKPAPLRRAYIPKRDGSKRPLGIPTIKDRIVQMAVKLVIEPIFEADFEDNSYGYRPKKNAHQAAREIRKYLNFGYTEVIDSDISDCFGSIPHDELLNMVARRISDGRMLRLIKIFLKAGVMQEWQDHDSTRGTPQGGVISPLLANIYLDRLDKGWKLRFAPISKMVRYADDIVILTKGKAKVLLHELDGILRSMRLDLKMTKTKIVNAQEEVFDFLGFSFKRATSMKTGRKAAMSWPSHQSEMAIKQKIRTVTNFRRPVRAEQIVNELNPKLRGWVNYHRVFNASRKFSKIREYTEARVRKFIRKRGKRKGYGYGKITKDYLYNQLGLYNDYRIKWMKA